MPLYPSDRFATQSYWSSSRAPRYSLVFALPLLLLYEALAASIGGGSIGGVRNGADVIVKSVFAVMAGPYGALVFAVIVVGGSVVLVMRDLRRNGGKLRARVFALMLLESVALATVFGVVVGTLTAYLLGQLDTKLAIQTVVPIDAMDRPTKLMLSVGAGLYEELLFRVILVSALAWAARVLLGLRPASAGAVAVVVGALTFSAFHYVGAYGDPFEIGSFAFRFIAGLFFSALYVTRGFGITAWTHALYDVFLLVLG